MTLSEARSRPRQLAVDTLWVGALMVSAAIAAYVFAYYLRTGHLGGDARAYWLSGHTQDLYARQPKQWGAYLYSPAFAQAVRPLTLLPLGVFCVGWIAAEAIVYIWLLAPLGRWAPVAFLWCASELCWGNVYAWFALVTVIGFRRPWAWAFPALTKIAPAQGILWFAVRREWRTLGFAVGSTLVIALLSFALAPQLWTEWFRFLRDAPADPFTGVRLIGTCGLTVFGALTGRRWLLAPAMALACPVFNVTFSLALLAALPRLRKPKPDPAGSRPTVGTAIHRHEHDDSRAHSHGRPSRSRHPRPLQIRATFQVMRSARSCPGAARPGPHCSSRSAHTLARCFERWRPVPRSSLPS